MLDAFGIGFRRFGRHAERAQKVDDEPVARPHAGGERVAFFGEDAAIRPRGGSPARFTRAMVLIAVA